MTIGGDGDDNTRGTGDIVYVFAVCYIGTLSHVNDGNCI